VSLNEQQADRLTPTLLLRDEARDMTFKPFNAIFILQFGIFASPTPNIQAGGQRLFGCPRLIFLAYSQLLSILKWVLRVIEWVGTDWIDGAHDRDQWRVVVNTVINIRVP
jgi:hypothetical protein